MASSGSFNTSGYEGRYLTFSWEETSQSIANNTTTISWTLKGAGTGESSWYKAGAFKVVIAGETVYSTGESDRITLYNGTTVASGTYTFTHNSDGTKTFTASAQGGIYTYAVNCTGSKTFTLDTIARKSTLSASNGTLGTAQTLTVTRQATSLTHTITYSCGDASGTICTKSSNTSISWTPPLTLANQNTTGTSVSVKFTITTYTGSTSVGSNTKTITCSIPSSVKPSCTVSVTDPTGYADTYGGYIKGLSKFKVVVTATTSYGSAIASYSTTANGSKYTAASFTTGVLTSSGILSIAATVTDKRGRTGSATESATVLNYSAPKVTALSVHRCDADGTANDQGECVRVVFSGSVTSLNSKNSASYTLKYKKTTDTSYTSVTLSDYTDTYSVSNAAYIFAADSGSSYDVQIVVKDNFKTTTSTTSASTAFTLMHFSAGGTGVGIGKVAEEENLLDIGIPVRFRAGIESKTLWSGAYYMNGSQTVTLSEAVSKQPNGIVLVFSEYVEGASANQSFHCRFIPKMKVALHPGMAECIQMTTSTLTYFATKYLYINDEQITGHDNNTLTGTGTCGITYTNNRFVLRYVFGV